MKDGRVLIRLCNTLFTGVLMLACTVPGSAQVAEPLNFHHISSNEGLSQNFVFCMLQDHCGLVWAGTKDGLNCYDGYTFTVYRHDAFDRTSLGDNYVTALYEDERNNLWIGTRDGEINLFDRKKNRFIRVAYQADSSVDYKAAVTAVITGPDHHLWIGNDLGEIAKLDLSTDETDSLFAAASPMPVYVRELVNLKIEGRVNAFCKKDSGLWVGSTRGLRQVRWHGKAELATPALPVHAVALAEQDLGPYEDIVRRLSPAAENIRSVTTDSSGRLWIASDSVLYCLNNRARRFDAYISLPAWEAHAEMRSLTASSGDEEGTRIWIGMSAGLAIFNPRDTGLLYYTAAGLHKRGKTYGETISAFCDKSGMIWLGSNGYGINTYANEGRWFNLPEEPVSNEPGVSLRGLSVRSFCEITDYPEEGGDVLWIGTQHNLYALNRATGIPTRIVMADGDHSVYDGVYSMAEDTTGNLWVGYQYGLMKYNLRSGDATYYNPYNNESDLADQRVMKVFIDHSGKKWILTDYCLARFEEREGRFVHFWYSAVENKTQRLDTYPVIYAAPDHNFWLGTNAGLFCFNPAKEKFIAHYKSNRRDPQSISSDWITSIVPDRRRPRKYLWLGTVGGGLERFDLETGKCSHFNEKDGLANGNVYGVLADELGRLWLSTNKGISCFDPREKTFKNYDVHNNLQNNEFNFGAFYKNTSGEMFFGGITGFNHFFPRNIRPNHYEQPVLITGFDLPGKGRSGTKWMPPNISVEKEISLPYDRNSFTITVSSLDFSAPEKNKYAYRIRNKNTAWTALGSDRKITFTDMPPGRYVFQAKGSNSTGYWNPNPVQLTIFIVPPWWKTGWAYAAYAGVFVALLFFLRRREVSRIRLRNRLKMEAVEAGKLKELDRLKSRFFANISHEFRTPLTLIIGPLNDLMRTGDTGAFIDILPETCRNSERLLHLINQLLDLSRLDAGKYEINTARGNIILFVQQIVNSFSSLAHAKDIRLEVDVDPRLRDSLVHETVAFYFDEDIVEKILVNLLSNAFKFTPERGRILVTLALAENEDFLKLMVADNGEGIPANKIPFIFDRFYQAGNGRTATAGSGIGLALIRELVELHEGRVTVSSVANQATTFTCFFPLNKEKVTAKENTVPGRRECVAGYLEPPETMPLSLSDREKAGQVVLLVDDHQDVRKYIGSHLKSSYKILEARHGRQGFEIASERLPDLVISDVMMPGMDGYALCRALKTDDRTSHIPVILLTARAEDRDRIDGFEMGADAYLIKPFDAKELQIRVRNLIISRNRMRAKFSGRLVIKPSEITVTSQDSAFMEKLLHTVEAHMDDEKFSVEVLAGEVNMSVSQINRKLKAIINRTTLQFIRSVRLQRAMELLKNDAGTIAEIAYRTGFESPSYFSRMFKIQFGCLPSEREKFPDGDEAAGNR